MDRLGDLFVLSLIVVELNGAWVHVAIFHLPGVQFGLQSLVLHTVKLKIFRTHNQISSLETLLGMGTDQGKDRHRAYTPLVDWLGALTHRNCRTCDSMLNKSSCGEARR